MNAPQILLYLIYITILLAVSITDLRELRVPNKIIGPAILFALFMPFFVGQPRFASAIIGGFSGSLLLLAPSLIARKQMFGMGDVKLAFFIGLILGASDVWYALLLGCTLASLLWIGVFFRWIEASIRFPFAPFLSMGAITFLTRAYFLVGG